jgi:hypothetical protein
LACKPGFAVRHLHVYPQLHELPTGARTFFVQHIRFTCQRLNSGEAQLPQMFGGALDATLAASSQDVVLVPISSMTL